MGGESGDNHERLDPRAVVDNANKRRIHGRAGESREVGTKGTADAAVLVRSQGLPRGYLDSIFVVERCKRQLVLTLTIDNIRENQMTGQGMELEVSSEMVATLLNWLNETTEDTTPMKFIPRFSWQTGCDYFDIPSSAMMPDDHIGNPSCINNARSSYLQCAVNPMGDCGDCKDYRDIVNN
jgi:hypothetical protein